MHALVRRPGPRLADGLVTHVERQPVDVDLAVRQWERHREVLHEHGWITSEVAPIDECPDAVFVEDTAVIFDDLAVVTRPGAPERAAETAAIPEALAGHDLEVVRLSTGTLDGGDVLKVGRDVYVGVGARTSAPAVAELAVTLAPRGWTVRPVPVRRVLHLKSAVTALPDGRVIGYEPVVDDPSAFPELVAVPEPDGAHVVLLGGDRLLMSATAPRTAEMFADMGYRPVPVELTEFEKLEGCVTCLSVRIRR